MRQLKCPKAEAKRILDKFHEQHPYIGRRTYDRLGPIPPAPGTLNGHIKAVLDERGYITTLWGRHLHPETEHKAINALIQGCAADLLRASLVEVYMALNGMKSHIINNVHDEIQVDAAKDEIEHLIPLVQTAMCDWPRVTDVLPIEVDVEMSTTNWAEKAPFEEAIIAR